MGAVVVATQAAPIGGAFPQVENHDLRIRKTQTFVTGKFAQK